MEIVPTQVTFDDRVAHLKQTEGNIEMNKRPFPWIIAIAAAFIGVLVFYTVNEYQKNKKKAAVS